MRKIIVVAVAKLLLFNLSQDFSCLLKFFQICSKRIGGLSILLVGIPWNYMQQLEIILSYQKLVVLYNFSVLNLA